MASSKYPDRCLDEYPTIYRNDFLSGKHAFVTGGGSGINFRIVEGLMRHGCNVAIASRTYERVKHASDELNNKIGKYNNTQCICYSMDVSNYDQVVSIVNKILSQFGKIDILVNGAAGNFLCSANDLTSNAFSKVMQIDTVGTFNVSKAVASLYMTKLKKEYNNLTTHNNTETIPDPSKYNGGVIINITATLQYTGEMLQVHASSAKAANDAMTRVLCNEWGRYGIRVNGVAPGPIADTTGMDKLGGFMPKSMQEVGIKRIPMQRYGTRKEIADAVLYMVSDVASYVTGEILVVDGGAWMNTSGGIGNTILNSPKWLSFIRNQKTQRKKTKTTKK